MIVIESCIISKIANFIENIFKYICQSKNILLKVIVKIKNEEAF